MKGCLDLLCCAAALWGHKGAGRSFADAAAYACMLHRAELLRQLIFGSMVTRLVG